MKIGLLAAVCALTVPAFAADRACVNTFGKLLDQAEATHQLDHAAGSAAAIETAAKALSYLDVEAKLTAGPLCAGDVLSHAQALTVRLHDAEMAIRNAPRKAEEDAIMQEVERLKRALR